MVYWFKVMLYEKRYAPGQAVFPLRPLTRRGRLLEQLAPEMQTREEVKDLGRERNTGEDKRTFALVKNGA